LFNSINPTTKAKIINKKFPVCDVKKLPVVFNGKISETKMIKKGTNMFFISGSTFELRVKVIDLIKIIEKITIDKNNPIIPKEVAISK
tara:strand:+ start:232 stop:495 length:264 start_codon:yes stop_codon:yes gene_type:complete